MTRVPARRWALRQLQVLHRHGDRSPLLNVCQGGNPGAVEDEVCTWRTQLPTDATLTALTGTYRLRHAPEAAALPQQHVPFGCLTDKGLEQMRDRGRRVAALCESEGLRLGDLAPRDIEVYCNAFTRTQLSVQGLLTGLLADHRHLLPSIHVLPLAQDMIHAYSVFPEIADLKRALDDESDVLRERELAHIELKTELHRLLPAFHSGSREFLWTYAGDYFTCRRAHELPFLPHTEALLEPTLHHLSFRFRQFYEHRRIRSLVAGQLLKHILDEMNKTIEGNPDQKKLLVYSGHDVSILALLHAIDADILQDETWWPEYSSALTFELLEDDRGAWFARVRLNGEVLSLRQVHRDHCAHADLVEIAHERVDF